MNWQKIAAWIAPFILSGLGWCASYVIDLHDRVVAMEAYTKGIVEIMIETKKKEDN